MSNKVRAATVSVASNTILVVGKLAVGVITGSVSVTSEAIHSGIDLVAAMIALGSIRAASRPADETHRYGHGKIENLSALIEALLISVAAGWILWQAGHKLLGAQGSPEVGLGLWVMGASAAVNTVVSMYLMRVAKAEDSAALAADAMHLRTDVWTSVGVFVGLVAVRVTGLAWLDPVAAIAVGGMILHAGWELSHEALRPLLDETLPEADEAAIRSIIEKEADHFVEYHDLRTRRSGAERHIDFHLVVHGGWPLEQVHQLCDRIEEAIKARFPRAKVLIHEEPCSENCRVCRQTTHTH